nr:5'-nucleotidase C-terminal domain-containing protein [Lachnospiraceae bacterium]
GDGSINADLRIIYTTDIHGQVINYDYQDKEFVNRGLNLLYPLINEARAEAGEGNYLTFDVGDSIMDFTTDHIYAVDSTVDQPVFKALSMIGYDAITMGNHDFDYGYDYLMTQLNDAGITNLTVLSNVYSVNNFAPAIGSENRIIEKYIKNEKGEVIPVKVGLIGEVTPNLSARTEAYKNKVFTEDIIENATKQVQSLKAQGADIIIALAHTGFGSETPEKKDANAAYALTKVDGIDVVLAGHEHGEYPLKTGTDKHYLLSGVDKNTTLVNGKRMLMIPDSCQKIGITDLHLKYLNGKVTLMGSDWEMVEPDENTVPDPGITATMGDWNEILNNYCGDKLIDIKDKASYNNYLLSLENTEIMQLIHNTQFDCAYRAILENNPDYINLPIISAARYNNENGRMTYADIKEKIMSGDVQSITGYHKYLCIYKITGAQLMEWLEWTASAYQTVGTSKNVNWNDVVSEDYLKKSGRDMLLQKDWESSFGHTFFISGVEYTIDTTKEARYNYMGSKVSDSNRITSLTLNGAAIAPEMEILVVSEKISNSLQNDATNGVVSNVIYKSHDVIQDEVEKYILRQAFMGDLEVKPNHDETLYIPNGHEYMLVSGKGAEEYVFEYPDVEELYAAIGEKEYYSCKRENYDYTADTYAPTVYIAHSVTDTTNGNVKLKVCANDISGVSEVKIAKGVYDKNNAVWKTDYSQGGAEVLKSSDGTVNKTEKEVAANGIYTVYASDARGNCDVYKTAVVNINPAQLIKPTVNVVKNKAVKVTGTASPNLKVVVTIGKKIYNGTTDKNGEFSVEIPVQKAKTKIKVYVESDDGRKSSVVTVAVKRVGPNCPGLKKVGNKDEAITGKTNDNDVKMFVQIGNKVYVSETEGKKYYEDCDSYDDSLTIETTAMSIKKGKYSIKIPVQNAGKAIKVFNVDNIGRVSRKRQKKVVKKAANKPVVYESIEGESKVYGNVANGLANKIYVKINDTVYSSKITDEDGYFEVNTRKLKAGIDLKVYAKDKKSRKSVVTQKTVSSIEKVLEESGKEITSNRIKDKSKKVSGNAGISGIVEILSDKKNYYTKADSNGEYTADTKKGFDADSIVYLVARKINGSIINADQKTVKLAPPDKPYVTKNLDKNTTDITVYATERCLIKLKLNDKYEYENSDAKYSSAKDAYKYNFSVTKLKKVDKKKVKIKISAINDAGKTKADTIKVKVG